MRDSQKTKANILAAAEQEFASNGLAGARIDIIAKKAFINKRMLYEYFGSKENLYKSVLQEVFSRIGRQETEVLGEGDTSAGHIRQIIRFYFEFLRDNPTYVNLLLWENLNQGQYVHEFAYGSDRAQAFVMLRDIIIKGMSDGVFRAEINPEEVILSLLTYPFCYFSNRYTLSKLLGRNLIDHDNLEKQTEYAIQMFSAYLMKQNTPPEVL